MRVIRFCLVVALLLSTMLGQASASSAASALSPASEVIRVPQDVASLQDAINQVSDGGIIELAQGVYYAPPGGFRIADLAKSFTIRAVTGTSVVLDGGGTSDILRFENSAVDRGGPVTFENLRFAHGYSASEGVAGGVTLYRARATFVNCVFSNNTGAQQDTCGGAVLVGLDSVVFFFDCLWEDNSARLGGGGLAVASHSRAYVHGNRFSHNISNPPGHSPSAGGGAIAVGSSVLRVSNCRFENNQAGSYGGALYALGAWTDPVSADILVSNSTFVNNQAVRDASVSSEVPTGGGAINVEDRASLRIYSSRFITNGAMIGGGVNVFRATAAIYGSLFLGNWANPAIPGSGFGGAISVSSTDGASDGYNNWPAAQLTVEDTWIHGRYGTLTTVGSNAGGLAAIGDGSRVDGNPAVPDMGTIADNRAKVAIRRVVLSDCDVSDPSSGSGVGGALEVALADLTMEDSLVIHSDAMGDQGMGGGIVAVYHSLANITRTTIARNTAGRYGGGVYAQGSTINIRDSNLIANKLGTAQAKSEYYSYGAALFSAPDESRNVLVDGTVENSVFSGNVGLAVFDDDRSNGPINAVRYNGNRFYETTFGDKVYRDSLSSSQNVAGLNSLVVTRASNVSATDKSQVASAALGAAPAVGAIRAVPPIILPAGAAGDPSGSTPSYLAYAWSDGSATLDGLAVSGNAGLTAASAPGTHMLSVKGTSFTATVVQGVEPQATLQASPNASSATLSWALQAGTFLDAAMDQGVEITAAPTGSVQVFPAVDTATYRLYIITQEGGIVIPYTGSAPTLSVPASLHVLTGLNRPVTRTAVPVANLGSQSLTWKAYASGNLADRIHIEVPSGQVVSSGTIPFSVDMTGLAVGTYSGSIVVDAGSAGSSTVAVTVRVVSTLRRLFLPLNVRG